MEMMPVESSQIAEIGHDPATNTLAVRFKGKGDKPGTLYHYANVPAELHANFMKSPSKGSFLGQHIKPHKDKFPFTRINEEHKT